MNRSSFQLSRGSAAARANIHKRMRSRSTPQQIRQWRMVPSGTGAPATSTLGPIRRRPRLGGLLNYHDRGVMTCEDGFGGSAEERDITGSPENFAGHRMSTVAFCRCRCRADAVPGMISGPRDVVILFGGAIRQAPPSRGSSFIGMPDVGSRSGVPSVARPPCSARCSTFRTDRPLGDNALAARVSALVRVGHERDSLRADSTHTQNGTQAHPKRVVFRVHRCFRNTCFRDTDSRVRIVCKSRGETCPSVLGGFWNTLLRGASLAKWWRVQMSQTAGRQRGSSFARYYLTDAARAKSGDDFARAEASARDQRHAVSGPIIGERVRRVQCSQA